MGRFLDFKFRERGPIGLLLIIFAAAVWLRFNALGFQSLWLDEYLSLKDSVNIEAILKSFHSPGYFLTLKGWTTLFGTSIEAGRSLSAFADSLSVLLLYLLVSRLFNPGVGLAAALLYAFAPMSVWYARELRMYSLWGLMSLASAYSVLCYLDGRARITTLACFWVFSLAALSSHFYTVFFLGGLGVGAAVALWLSVRIGERSGKQARRQFINLFGILPLGVVCLGLLKWERFGGSLATVVRRMISAVAANGHGALSDLPASLMFFSFWGTPRIDSLAMTVASYALGPLLILGLLTIAFDRRLVGWKRALFICYAVLPVLVINTTGIRNYERLSYPALAMMMTILAYLISRMVGFVQQRQKVFAASAAAALLVCTWWPQLERVLYERAYPLVDACGDLRFQNGENDFIAATAFYIAPVVDKVCGFPKEVVAFENLRKRLSNDQTLRLFEDDKRVWIFFSHKWSGDSDFASVKYLREKGYEVFFYRQYSPILELVGLHRTVEPNVIGKSPRKKFEPAKL